MRKGREADTIVDVNDAAFKDPDSTKCVKWTLICPNFLQVGKLPDSRPHVQRQTSSPDGYSALSRIGAHIHDIHLVLSEPKYSRYPRNSKFPKYTSQIRVCIMLCKIVNPSIQCSTSFCVKSHHTKTVPATWSLIILRSSTSCGCQYYVNTSATFDGHLKNASSRTWSCGEDSSDTKMGLCLKRDVFANRIASVSSSASKLRAS